MRQYFIFNNKSCKDFSLFLTDVSVYDSPSPDVETMSVPGLNGDLIQNNAKSGQRRFANVDIKYTAFFLKGLPVKTAAVKSWLLSPSGYCKLQDTYDPDFFRMAACISAAEFDVTNRKAAKFEIAFNCKPQRWSVSGQRTVTLTESGSVLRNPFDFHSQPLITVNGTGEGVLTIGDCSVKIYSFESGAVTLNCETQNAYLSDGTFCNTSIYSEEFPTLSPENNTVEWSGGITSVEIIPRLSEAANL